MTDVAMIGDNNPPTPFDEHSEAINNLYEEAKLWLDGEGVQTEEHAEGVSNLMNYIRDARKKAEESRKEEKKPFDDGAKAVQAKWVPIIKLADDATTSCKAALKPYLEEKDRIAREEAEKARKEAEEAERKAQEAFKQANPENLSEREDAHKLAEEAARSKNVAKALDKKPTNTKTVVGKAVGLRTRRVAVITDLRAAAAYFWRTDEGRKAFEETVQKLANNHMKEAPGIEIREERSVA